MRLLWQTRDGRRGEALDLDRHRAALLFDGRPLALAMNSSDEAMCVHKFMKGTAGKMRAAMREPKAGRVTGNRGGNMACSPCIAVNEVCMCVKIQKSARAPIRSLMLMNWLSNDWQLGEVIGFVECLNFLRAAQSNLC